MVTSAGAMRSIASAPVLAGFEKQAEFSL